jgi:uncharacterized protein YbjT (DUF2867 family)
MALTTLVTGASGFIGSHLAPALEREGHVVRALTRRPEQYDGAGEPVAADVLDAASLREAMAGVDAAYYLVHSLGSADFAGKDAAAARTFGEAAAETGVRQIIYLGGLGDDRDDLSPHLRSRREVEALLGDAGVPVTVLRAAIVVGHGGISWEITRQLAANLPAMVAPRWVATKTQPIALADVVRYLVGVLGNEAALGQTFEIGGAEVLSYAQMLMRTARAVKGHGVPIVVVPLLSPRLSSRWLALVTDVDPATGRTLVESMTTEVVVRDESIRAVVPLQPMGFDAMVQEALAERARAEASR